MKKSLSIEEFLETRPDITPEMLEEGRLLVEAKIKGYELQQARKACGMTQKEVAAKMGVSQKRISDLENGSIDVMQVETLRRYITSLGGTLEITAKLPGVSLELQGLGTDHPLFKQEACALAADLRRGSSRPATEPRDSVALRDGVGMAMPLVADLSSFVTFLLCLYNM